MKINTKICLLIGLAATLLLSGCMEMAQPPASANPANTRLKTDPTSARQFQEVEPEGPTAVESAIELSKKYAALSEEMTKLQLDKQKLATENSRLTQQITVMESELNQAKKELGEANDLLVEMRIELNNWKSDVLGFRDEMRQADKAQLETLMKILTILGGEAADPADAAENQ